MSFIDAIIATVAPHECLGCGAESGLICPDCSRQLRSIPERCYRCKKLSTGCLTCRSCRSSSKLVSVRAATVYDGLAKDMVWRLKFHGAQAAAQKMATSILPVLPVDRSVVLVHVPTTTSRVRQRGYDQARLLARAVALQTKLPTMVALARLGQHHQVGASRQQRLTQLKQGFRVTKPELIRGADILLVDDVLTTGATLEAAAACLKAAGAKRVDAVVFAQA